MNTAFRTPPHPTTTDGAPRTVGVEVEFANLDAPSAAAVVRRLYGGALEPESPHRCRVTGTRLGDFAVELDMRSAHPGKAPDKVEASKAEEGEAGPTDKGLGKAVGKAVDGVVEALRPWWGNIGSLVMPFEIAAPPVPIARLAELEPLFSALSDQGAAGTDASPLFAFGLHLNPQVARTDGDYVLDHLKAFLLLAPWLRREIRVDPTRRLTGFIAAFPVDYAVKVVDPAYRPDLDGLIGDYLEANPTRNRELDLFPLFAHLAPQTMAAKLADPHVRPRPTFHYRLPNARLGDPDWRLAQDWNRWVAVEELAADRGRLDALGTDFRAFAARKALDDWAAEAGRRLAV
ncbi:putative amidoligase enzyme [Azospirillum brasilense]|uniref:Putative amidoligase enzyme n=1 Tax=Azospirillum brasilense TaxID=192 RepID=A0A560CJY1_AZOBR|nr:amidoligase family protein [Azospirillum brasilense]TWA85117.1 putative amidoligase enzyme [Azospirillum brasilense]